MFMNNSWILMIDYCVFYRAREMFYYLKGRQIDYGEEHNKACGHYQFQSIYEQG
ncbi:putative alpha/Beta hydrolase [Helianthus anomalus]